eukprot:GFKZ01006455.1.p1 GENE.GFKZ01006455.1~~GFKZ01006455.1.p1  ORF type:complete len:371 (+),score=63.15 GFKZ01006455.1:305-1417(+)
MRPSPRSTRAKKPSMPTLQRRRPRVGDVVDVFWDDRQVYYRGRLVKRYYPHPFGFYIRYDDGDYISTDLNCFMWHYAADPNALMPSCCDHPDDFQEGQLEELWGKGGEVSDRRAREADGIHSETTATQPRRGVEHHDEDMEDRDEISAALLPDATRDKQVHGAGGVDTLRTEAKQTQGGTEEKVMEVNERNRFGATDGQGGTGDTGSTREAVDQGNCTKTAEVVPSSQGGEQVAGGLVRMRSAMSASGEMMEETQTERTRCKEEIEGGESGGKTPSWDNVMRMRKAKVKKGLPRAGEDSPTASCQSLTTAEGFCLLDDLRRAKQRMRTSRKRSPPRDKPNPRKNGSEAGTSLEGHWKRRLRRRYLGESQE